MAAGRAEKAQDGQERVSARPIAAAQGSDSRALQANSGIDAQGLPDQAPDHFGAPYAFSLCSLVYGGKQFGLDTQADKRV